MTRMVTFQLLDGKKHYTLEDHWRDRRFFDLSYKAMYIQYTTFYSGREAHVKAFKAALDVGRRLSYRKRAFTERNLQIFFWDNSFPSLPVCLPSDHNGDGYPARLGYHRRLKN